MIEIQRNYVSSRILGTLDDKVVQALRLKLRYKVPGFRFAFARKTKWSGDGYKYLITPKQQKFPSGLLYMVEETFKEYGVEYILTDLRTKPTPSNPITPKQYVLRDYQEAMEKACLDNCAGIVRAATGSGKTAVFTSILGKLNGLKQVVYVRKLDLMQQTIRVLTRELDIPIGEIGGGKVNIQDLSVAMVPTVARALGEQYVKYDGHENDDDEDTTELTVQQKQAIKEYVENADVFICDECHCLSATTVQMVSNYSKKAYYRLGFSATPWRTDGTDILLNAATGPQIIDVPASELIKRKFLVPPRIHFYKMARDFKQRVPSDYQSTYTQFIVENKDRNDKIVKLATFLAKQGERPVILVQRQQHGKTLEKMFEGSGLVAKFIYGESSMTDRWLALEDFQAGVIDVIIGSSILQEGIDVPCITALINAAAGKSSSAYYQKIGRAIRTNDGKTRAIVVDFIDQVKWLKDHAMERIRILRTEPLYQIKIQD